MHQMDSNLETINHLSRSWSFNFKLKNQAQLREVKGRLFCLLISKPLESLYKEEESELGSLLNKKVGLLVVEESKWRLKSRAI
jgi:hypothetical protein